MLMFSAFIRVIYVQAFGCGRRLLYDYSDDEEDLIVSLMSVGSIS